MTGENLEQPKWTPVDPQHYRNAILAQVLLDNAPPNHPYPYSQEFVRQTAADVDAIVKDPDFHASILQLPIEDGLNNEAPLGDVNILRVAKIRSSSKYISGTRAPRIDVTTYSYMFVSATKNVGVKNLPFGASSAFLVLVGHKPVFVDTVRKYVGQAYPDVDVPERAPQFGLHRVCEIDPLTSGNNN